MKYYYYADGTTFEAVKKFIDWINDNPDGDINVILNSSGGDSGVALVLSKVLRDNKDRIILTASTGVYSSAFKIFYDYIGKRQLLSNCRGMWHFGSMEIEMSTNWKPTYFSGENQKEQMENEFDKVKEFPKSFMTKDEYKRFLKGEEIYFTSKRMKQIFPNVEWI